MRSARSRANSEACPKRALWPGRLFTLLPWRQAPVRLDGLPILGREKGVRFPEHPV